MYNTLDSSIGPTTLLLKGEPGSGKTFKSAHWPRPVIFSFDNNLSGLRRLSPERRAAIRVINPRLDDAGKKIDDTKIWDVFVQRLAACASDPTVGTIVIDSLTTMAEVLMDKILGTGAPSKKVEIQHWGDFARYLKWLGENLMCANDLDKHVVLIAHEQIDKEELTGRVKYLLNIGGQMKHGFDLYFTDCWRTYTKGNSTGGVDYWVRTLPTDYHSAKTSMDVKPDFKWDTEAPAIIKYLEDSLKKEVK